MVWGCVAAISTFAACQRGVPQPALVQLGEAQRLTADLRVAFAKAASASDRAVMADTDEASIAFAREAKTSTETVERDAQGLAPRLDSLGYRRETRLLEEFSNHFAKYRSVDREVLQLAVENTNLKAQRLAFGPVREAADAFRDSVAAIALGAAPKDRCRAETLAARATLAVREVQDLQAPHIAEATDQKMDRLEEDMAVLLGSARDAVTKLGEFVAPATRPAQANATAALARFETIAAELVTLSRRNSNVRSLALALGPKPALTAACEASLTALAEALATEGSSATR